MSAHLAATPAAWAGDRDPCDNSTGGAPSPSAVAPHAAPASGNRVDSTGCCFSCRRVPAAPCRLAGVQVWKEGAEF